jgi:hypothetical protein
MENDPIITFVAMNISPEAGERYDKWWDAAYGPMFIKNVGARGIDRTGLSGKIWTCPEISPSFTMTIWSG